MSSPVRSAFAMGLAVAALLASAATLSAQQPALTIRAASRDTATVESGEAITAGFAVRNTSGDTVKVAPKLQLPAGWRAVTGMTSFTLAPQSADSWLAGVSVPASAAAGTYVVRGTVGAGITDSLVVRVLARRALEVVALESPGWVFAGDGFEARFLVHNAGNIQSSIALAPFAGRGVQVTASPAHLTLGPGVSSAVIVRAAMTIRAVRSADDMIQLAANDTDDPSIRATAAARTTVVPRAAGTGEYAMLPAVVAVRTGGGAAGVSPLVLAGSGRLADGRTNVDVFLQAPTDQHSQWGFGERDEYHVNVSRPGLAIRAGDNLFGSSTLMSSGIMGTGVEGTMTRGALSGGAFVQRLRWTPGTPFEESAYLTYARDSVTRVTGTTLFRQSGGSFVMMGGATGGTTLPFGGALEIETAASDSAGRVGGAWRARLAGVARGVQYDVTTLAGSDAFSGGGRGTAATSAAASMHLFADFDVSAATSVRSWSHSVSSIGRMGQRYATGSVTATWRGATSLEYGFLSRRDEGSALPIDGAQHGLRATVIRQLGPVGFSATLERGTVREQPDSPSASYALGSLTMRVGLGSFGSIGLSGTRAGGRTLTGANGDVLSAGGNAQLHLPFGLEFGLTTNAQRATFGMLDSSGAWFSVTDLRLDRRFANGTIVGLHGRALQNPTAFGSPNSRAVYLEVRMPFRVPTGRSREVGRVVGRVMDAEQGKPVSGVLVRLDDQAAVSDREGRVTFAGLDPDVHRVVVDPTGVAAGAILVGDLSVDTRHAGEAPSTFAVSVTRGAQVAVAVRRYEVGTTEGGPSASPAGESSALGGVLVKLQGERDTLYQVSDARGSADFRSVAPGRWTVAVGPVGSEAFMEFERDRIDVTVAAGGRVDAEFRLMPVQRQVKLIEGGATLRARILPEKPKPEPERE